MATLLIPDGEVVAVMWARQDVDLNRLLNGAIATQLPKTTTMPFLTAQVVGGGPISGEAIPMGVPLIQWDAYGARLAADRVGADWASASLVIRTLEAKLRDLEDVSVDVTGGGFISSVVVTQGPHRVPDPGGLARFQLQALMAIHA